MRRTGHPSYRSSCWRVVVVVDCDVQGAVAATTTDIERVSLARAVDRAPERDGGYDLLDHNAADGPPEIHWP